jgi:hypothetical protein
LTNQDKKNTHPFDANEDLQGYNKMDGLNTLPSSSSREGGEFGGASQVD